MTKFSFQTNLLIFASFILFLNCSENKEEIIECDTSGISASISFKKVSEKCKDIDLPWDIYFGVEVEFEINVRCEGDCDGRMIYYQKDKLLKKPDGIIDLNSPIFSAAFYNCNSLIRPGETRFMEVGEPPNVIYAVGDTLRWEFFDARLCLTDDITACTVDNENEPIDVPDFSFEYIISPEDFECE
ncbi:MAG: hypothetical protein AAFZ15_18395 [Bacteroidota bacterium]